MYLFLLFMVTITQILTAQEELYLKLRQADDKIIEHLHKEHNNLFYGPRQLHFRLRELVDEYNALLIRVIILMRTGSPKAYIVRQALTDDGGPRYKYEIRSESLIAKSNWTTAQMERLSDLLIATNELWHKLKKKIGAPTSRKPVTDYDTVYRIISHSPSEEYYYSDNASYPYTNESYHEK